MKNLIKVLVCCTVILLAFSGCRSTTLLNQRIILQSVGIDEIDGMLKMSGNAFITARNSGEGEIQTILAEGVTVIDAAEQMAEITGGQPYFAHNRAIVIGRNMAYKGINTVMGFFTDYYECRPTAVLYVAEKEALQIIEAATNDPSIAAGLDDLVRIGEENGSTVSTSVWEAAVALADKDRDFCLPYLILDDEKKIVPSGSAVFRSDRQVCVLSSEETKGLRIIRGDIDSLSVSLENGNYGRISASVNDIKTEISIVIGDEGYPIFTVKTVCNGTISESEYGKNKSDEFLESAEKMCEEEVTHWIRSSIKTALRINGADPFDFGRVLKRRMPEYWNAMSGDWHNEMQKCKYTAEVVMEFA